MSMELLTTSRYREYLFEATAGGKCQHLAHVGLHYRTGH